MVGSELPLHSASALAGLIESREASPVEVVEAYLQRIDDLDFKFNSFITVLRERALEEARQAEREILAGNYRGPMHGIPVGVKDQIWTKDIRTTGGSRILADFVPDDDATVIANLRNAGAILLGKTNLTEFAVTGFTHRFSTPRNPWDLNISAGGSSSGSGAATAAFLCATSLGEDTGGSIRRPAAWCGIVGLRPGWGRVSRYGLMRGVWSMDTIGPDLPHRGGRRHHPVGHRWLRPQGPNHLEHSGARLPAGPGRRHQGPARGDRYGVAPQRHGGARRG